MRAFVLYFNGTPGKGIGFLQSWFALQTQTPRRVRRDFRGNSRKLKLFLNLAAFGLQQIDAQIQRAGLLQVLSQDPKFIAQLGLQRLRHPIGQVVSVRRHQGIRRNAVTRGQPLFFRFVECGAQEISRSMKPQNGQLALFTART